MHRTACLKLSASWYSRDVRGALAGKHAGDDETARKVHALVSKADDGGIPGRGVHPVPDDALRATVIDGRALIVAGAKSSDREHAAKSVAGCA
jgi:hypothetical protein